ncbi:MAG: RING finger protein [Thermoplasmata archaeon]
MVGISPYKISKELEEKAKEMRKKREILEKELPTIEEKIKILENQKLLNDEIKNSYENLKKLYDDKKFIEAYDEYVKLNDILNKSLTITIEENRKILEKYVESLKQLEIDVSDLIPKLQNIYSTENINEIKNEILKESIDLINKRIESILEKLPQNLRNEFLEKFSDIISKLNDINEYSLTILNDIKMLIYQYIADIISKKIEKLAFLQSVYQNIKPNISIFTIEQKKINELIQNNKHIEALDELDSFNNKMEEQIVRILTEMVRNLSMTIKNSERFGIDSSKYEEKLQEIFININNGEYINAINSMKDLTSKISMEKISIITQKLSDLSKRILDLVKQGENVKDLVTNLNRTKSLLENKEIDSALELLFDMEKKTKNVLELKEKLKNQLNEIRSNLAYLKFLNVDIDVNYLKTIDDKILLDPENAEELLEKFILNINEKAINGRDLLVSKIRNFINYVKENGIELNNSISKLNVVSSYKPMDFVRNLRDLIETVKQEFDQKFTNSLNDIEDKNALNSMMENFMKIKNDIVQSIEKLDFDGAKSKFDDFLNIRNSIKIQKLYEYYGKVKNILDALNKLNFNVGSLIKLVDDIYKSNVGEEIKKRYMNTILSELNKKIGEIASTRITYYEKLINLIKENNINIEYNELENILNEIKKENEITISKMQFILETEEIYINSFENTFTYITAKNLLDKRLKNYIKDENTYNNILNKYSGDNLINSIDKILDEFNVIISSQSFSHLEENIKTLQTIIQETGLYSELTGDLKINKENLDKLEELYNKVESTLLEFRNFVFNRLLDVKMMLNKYKINYLLNNLDQSIDYYSKGEYLKAYNTLQKIKSDVEKIAIEYDNAKKMLNDIYNNISFFRNVGLNLPKTYEFIENLEKALENGDIQKFKELYKTNYLTINDEITKVVKDFVDNVEKKINEKKGSMNTIVAEGLISSAKRTLRYDNPLDAFKQALEALENIKDIEMLSNVSEKLFFRMKETIKRFESQPPKDFLASFERINQLLNRGKYTAAIIEMSDILDKFEELSKKIKIIKDYIETLKVKINIATSVGAKVDKAIKMYQDSRNAFQAGKIDESIEILEFTIDLINASIEKIIAGSQITSKHIYAISKIFNLNIDEVYNKINEITSKIISSLLKLEDIENLNYLIIEFKQTNGDLEKVVNVNIFNIFKERLEQIKFISNNVKTSPEDVNYLLYLWNKRNYQMIADIFNLIEYKHYKELTKYLIDYVRDIFVYISTNILYHPMPDYAISETLEYSVKVAIIPPDELNSLTLNYKEKILNDIVKKLNEKLNDISKLIKDSEKLKLLKDLIDKKDFKNFEKNIIGIEISVHLIDLNREIFSDRIDKIMKMINELDKKNINVFDEKKILLNIDFSTDFSTIRDLLDNLEKNIMDKKRGLETKLIEIPKQKEELVKKQEVKSIQTTMESKPEIKEKKVENVDLEKEKNIVNLMDTQNYIDIGLTITLGMLEVPVKLNIKNNKINDINKFKLNVSGSLQPFEISLDSIKAKGEYSTTVKTKVSQGNVLKLKGEYEEKNNKVNFEKEIEFKPIIDRGFKITKSTGNEKCEICKRPIESNSIVLVCSKCGSTYHYNCAKKIGVCVKCGNKFYFAPTKDYNLNVKI